MTIETYNKATKILEERKSLEDKLYLLRQSTVDFYSSSEVVEICNRLFVLGQEFAAL